MKGTEQWGNNIRRRTSRIPSLLTQDLTSCPVPPSFPPYLPPNIPNIGNVSITKFFLNLFSSRLVVNPVFLFVCSISHVKVDSCGSAMLRSVAKLASDDGWMSCVSLVIPVITGISMLEM